ncbi:MAG: MFS transporter [Flavobacteriaceae bacterium]|jgi:predicted MFS family arabinose efflux permease|nr:MFS transporter [Flavobacteriaceae bacterium]
MKNQKNTISWKLLAAIITFAAIAPSVLMTAPVLASQLAVQLKLDEVQIGYLFMAELGAMSLATLPAYWWLTNCNRKNVARISAIIFFLGNITSTFFDSYLLLLLTRFITSLAGGSLMILCISSASNTDNPSRIYGFWVLGQLILGALGLLVLPVLFNFFGLKIVYIILAILIALCFPLTSAFSSDPSDYQDQTNTLNAIKVPFYATLFSITGVLLFYIGLSGIWTFMGKIAEEIVKISPTETGEILSIATVLGIVGAGSATLMGSYNKLNVLLWIGYGAMIISVALLIDTPSLFRFILAAFIFKFTWTFVLPFILGSIAELDPTGKLMNTINLVIGGGTSMGPAIAGWLIKDLGGIETLILFSIIALGGSMFFILFTRSKYKKIT